MKKISINCFKLKKKKKKENKSQSEDKCFQRSQENTEPQNRKAVAEGYQSNLFDGPPTKHF